jgi:PleD family two-component response regulator
MAALSLQAFDLSILDLSLPIVDGFRLIQSLQGSDDLTPAVMLIRALSVHGERLSVSIGVASRNERSIDSASLVKASDEALYRAKRAGRDRVEVEQLNEIVCLGGTG